MRPTTPRGWLRPDRQHTAHRCVSLSDTACSSVPRVAGKYGGVRGLERIVRTTYTVVDRGVPTGAQTNVLPFGCAYAIPDESTAESPPDRWVPCSLGAVFVRRDLSALDLTRIDLTMRWLASPPDGYIMGGYLDVLLADRNPLTVTVSYEQPGADSVTGGYVIPFRGVIALDQLPWNPSVSFFGSIGPRGAGSFTVGNV
jgi:hypothetical protein